MGQAIRLRRRQTAVLGVAQSLVVFGRHVQQAILQGRFHGVERLEELLRRFFRHGRVFLARLARYRYRLGMGCCGLWHRVHGRRRAGQHGHKLLLQAVGQWRLGQARQGLPCAFQEIHVQSGGVLRLPFGQRGLARVEHGLVLLQCLQGGLRLLARLREIGFQVFRHGSALGRLRMLRMFRIEAGQRLRQLAGGLAAGSQGARGGDGVDHGALQRHLRFQAGGQRGARGGKRRRQLGRGLDDLPLAVQLGHLVRAQFFIVQQALGRGDAGLGALRLGGLVTDQVDAALHQLGHATVRVAHGVVDFFQQGQGIDVFGRDQTGIGKFAGHDEIGSGGFVAGHGMGTRNLFGAARCALRRGGGLFCHGRIGCGSLAGRTLEEKFEHDGFRVDQNHHHNKARGIASDRYVQVTKSVT
ncbi:hypothetical protein D3C71_540260 [compost metagenome]